MYVSGGAFIVPPFSFELKKYKNITAKVDFWMCGIVIL